MAKIAIMGSQPLTKMAAPFSDPEWKIWACSPHNFEMERLPRVDEWFEVHVPAGHATRAEAYLDFVRDLSEQGMPVWMRDRDRHPHALPYPEKQLKERFNPFGFTSSIAYIAAKAIAELAPRKNGKAPPGSAIGFWGILQASQTEYSYQRPGIQYFIWEAHRHGIEVIAPDVSQLMRPQPDDW